MTKSNTVAPCDTSTSYHYEPLLETESSLMFFLAEPAIATISFFKNTDHAKSMEWMKRRIALLCNANPWLLGRIVKDKAKHENLLLATPQYIIDADIDAVICSQDSSLSNISTQTPYAEMSETVAKSNAIVKEGYKLVGKDSRISKFALVPVANGEIALIVSITHAVADGYTYYKIFSMLTEGADIESLSCVRKHNFIPKMKTAIGEEETKLLLSPALMLNFIPKMLCGPKAQFDARFVDEDKVQQAKQDSEKRCADKNIPEGGFACSTNDILTSTFSKATKADLLLMAINLRNRLEEANDKDAGNYESVVTYDSPSSAFPELIRQSLRRGAPFIRVGGSPLPGFFKMLRVKLALITNWAFPSFKADLKLFDSSTFELTSPIQIHLPIYDPSAVVCPLAVIFRPCFGKLAILYAGSSQDISHDRLVASGAPIGGSVNDTVFTSS